VVKIPTPVPSSSEKPSAIQSSLFDEASLVVAVPAEGQVARVRVEQTDLELDYSIPHDLADRVRPGTRVYVPLQSQRVAAVVVDVLPRAEGKFRLKPIAQVIGRDASFTPTLLKLAAWVADYYLCSQHQVLRTMLPQAVRQRPESFITDSKLTLHKPVSAADLEKLRSKAPMQARVLDLLTARGGTATLTELRKEHPHASRFLAPLLKKEYITRAEVRVERDPHAEEEFLPTSPLTLTEEQSTCYASVIAAIDSPQTAKPLLLYGVTGSGKTEVFLQAIAHVLSLGKTALVLVPEISLTPQTIERFKARFSERKDRIAVLHSHLSEGERHDEWFKVHERRADIVIGARSAIFAPLENVGIIIVDEEHEPSYKQDETPRYQARDVAVVRAKLEPCAVLLATATPSLESYQNARTGKYDLLRMTRRTDGKTMPLIRIVDLRLRRKKGGESPDTRILSEPLREAIVSRLAKDEQIILFLNRRGYNTSLTCPSCTETIKCQDCDVPMTLHRADERLVCHVCGARRLVPRKCPKCADPGIAFAGYGTERAEEVLRKAFPTARIARVDTDIMQKKNQLRDTLRDFRARKLDMLIGTQMIAKGLDFPNVTLVGVLNADQALNLPDIRAAERTFQLLTQVAGRAGRGEIKGEVFVQTFAPHTPAVQFSRHADFEGYADQECEQRKAFRYPPFTHMVIIMCRSKQDTLAEFTLQTLAGRLKQDLPENVVMGEPSPCALSKAHGQYRFQLLMRTESIRALNRHVRTVLKNFSIPPEVILTCDVDPMQMM
jgi:primosomal protein N' (replication factor Y) (superfamily II helicase)